MKLKKKKFSYLKFRLKFKTNCIKKNKGNLLRATKY